MGYGAAIALADEWSDWSDGPHEAYEILYGEETSAEKRTCPICDKRLKSTAGVIAHMDAKHTRPKHSDAIAAFIIEHGI